MKNTDKLVCAILTIVLGVLFITLKAEVISITMTVLGIALIFWGALDLLASKNQEGIIKLIVGIAVIVFGWVLVSVALYIMAIIIAVYGGWQLYQLIEQNCKDALAFISPVLCLITGTCLFFNQGGTVAWVFIVSGISLIVQGIILLIDCK